GHVAQRNDMGEADVATARPIDDGRDQGSRLGHERQTARQRWLVREAGVDADAWQHEAEAIGALDPQQVRLRGLQHLSLELRANTRRYDDRGAGPFLAELSDKLRHGLWWGDDDTQIRGGGQRGDRRVARLPL